MSAPADTQFLRDLAEEMKDPEFARQYAEAAAEITANSEKLFAVEHFYWSPNGEGAESSVSNVLLFLAGPSGETYGYGYGPGRTLLFGTATGEDIAVGPNEWLLRLNDGSVVVSQDEPKDVGAFNPDLKRAQIAANWGISAELEYGIASYGDLEDIITEPNAEVSTKAWAEAALAADYGDLLVVRTAIRPGKWRRP